FLCNFDFSLFVIPFSFLILFFSFAFICVPFPCHISLTLPRCISRSVSFACFLVHARSPSSVLFISQKIIIFRPQTLFVRNSSSYHIFLSRKHRYNVPRNFSLITLGDEII